MVAMREFVAWGVGYWVWGLKLVAPMQKFEVLD